MTAGSLVAANGYQEVIRVVNATTRDLRLAGESEAGKSGPDGHLPTGLAPHPAMLLQERVSLVVHEIFGSDPLSEQVGNWMHPVENVENCIIRNEF